jgi:hypothetical protein
MMTNVLIVLGFAAISAACLAGLIGVALYSIRPFIPEKSPQGDA